MNPNLKELVKDKFHKLLKGGYIYPISDSQQVSPSVVVPIKMENGEYV